jgi:metal-responsive CopG/Arc/MetJ family transcriptional regulator
VRKARITVSIDEDLLHELDEIGRQRKAPRSQVVERAIRLLLTSILNERLREGYEAMAAENRDRAEQAIEAQWEALR